MKILLSILVLFSQAFAVVIVPSNIDQKFDIDSVEGVGCLAVPKEFKDILKLKLQNQYTYGGNIQQGFYEYIVFTLQLDDSEREPIHELINHPNNFDSSSLIPFENILSIVRFQ